MQKMKRFLFILVPLLLFGIAIFFLVGRKDGDNLLDRLLPVDENADDWNGNQNLPSGNMTTNTIDIPGYDTLTFTCNSTDQKVNFYNPDTNTCLFKMTLFIDSEQYWQSSYVKPGTGFYDITLDKMLASGEYSAYLLIECFLEDGTALNSAKVEFNIISEDF